MYLEIKDGTGLIPTWWSAKHQVTAVPVYVATFDHDHAQYPSIMIKLPPLSEILFCILGSSYVEYQLYHHPYHSPALCFNFAYLLLSVSVCLTKDKWPL